MGMVTYIPTPVWDRSLDWWAPFMYDERGKAHPAPWPEGFDPRTLKRPRFFLGDFVEFITSTIWSANPGPGWVREIRLLGGSVPGYMTAERAIKEWYHVQPKYIIALQSNVASLIVGWECYLSLVEEKDNREYGV